MHPHIGIPHRRAQATETVRRMRPSRPAPLVRPPGNRHRPGWVAAGIGLSALALAACSAAPAAVLRHQPAKGTTVTSTAPPAAPAALCPLTGAPVPGGGPVPARGALGVKVDNIVTARPQTGLNHADIVFEEPVEGGITRYVAVFQCQNAPEVGPVRSARNIDIGILGEFGHPLLAHVGGINPVIANIDNSPVVNLDLGAHASVDQHPAGRHAPFDTYASTTALWSVFPTNTTPPAPVFAYSPTTPSGPGVSPVASVAIPFSSNSNVVWQYEPTAHAFLRSYGSTPDTLSTGAQNVAANVIVQFVHVTYGPWVENDEGGLEVQANLATHASGPALVFRSGVEISGTWSRSTLGQATQFTSSAGDPISLQPGATWVELVPTTVTVTGTPPAAGATP
jgi:Protein of unknown function (DUF3048) N-terminal domain/Protein of unknown function (DUF3048) C-terminal domain